MAQKKTKSSNVTRITASSAKTAKKKVEAAPSKDVKPKVAKKKVSPAKALKPFAMLIGYFKGAWFELKQVHWPDRRATWSLTAAVIIFTMFFVGLIVLLDTVFKYVFEIILG